ncbi:hypothetical protein FJC27_24115, partial [Escherichia coli]|nr:hypothetical protein [Escherichia coli]
YIQHKNYAAAFSLSTLWIFIFVKTIKKQLLTIRQSRQIPQNRPDVTVFRDHDMSPVGEGMELLKMTVRLSSPFYCYRRPGLVCYRSGREGYREFESG